MAHPGCCCAEAAPRCPQTTRKGTAPSPIQSLPTCAPSRRARRGTADERLLTRHSPRAAHGWYIRAREADPVLYTGPGTGPGCTGAGTMQAKYIGPWARVGDTGPARHRHTRARPDTLLIRTFEGTAGRHLLAGRQPCSCPLMGPAGASKAGRGRQRRKDLGQARAKRLGQARAKRRETRVGDTDARRWVPGVCLGSGRAGMLLVRTQLAYLSHGPDAPRTGPPPSSRAAAVQALRKA